MPHIYRRCNLRMCHLRKIQQQLYADILWCRIPNDLVGMISALSEQHTDGSWKHVTKKTVGTLKKREEMKEVAEWIIQTRETKHKSLLLLGICNYLIKQALITFVLLLNLWYGWRVACKWSQIFLYHKCMYTLSLAFRKVLKRSISNNS